MTRREDSQIERRNGRKRLVAIVKLY